MKKTIKIILYILLITIGSELITAVCTTPIAGLTITQNTTFCPGNYKINTSGNNYILINTSFVILDLNGSTITNNGVAPVSGWDIILEACANNVTIKNGILNGSGVGIEHTGYCGTPDITVNGLVVDNVTLKEMGGVGAIYIADAENFTIKNSYCYNFTDYGERTIGVHCVYVSCGEDAWDCADSGSLFNNLVYGVSASGFKFNGGNTIKNIQIYNNTFQNFHETQGSDIGIMLANTENFTIKDNLFIDDGIGEIDVGIQFDEGSTEHPNPISAHNHSVYNNHFNNITTGMRILGASYNNSAWNNTYSGSSLNLAIRHNANSSIFIYDNDSMKIGTGFGVFTLYLNFTGLKNFSIGNNNFTLFNGLSQWYPYDDVRNATDILIYDVNSYTHTLSTAQPLVVGDFGGCIVPIENTSYTINTNITTCTNLYYNITFIPGADGVSLNCNGATFYQPSQGNPWYDNDGAFKTNLKIENCNVYGSGGTSVYGIKMSRGDNVLIKNTTVSTFAAGIVAGDSSGNRAYNFTVLDSNITNSTACLANMMIYGGEYNLLNSHFDNAKNRSSCSQGIHALYISPVVSQSSADNMTINNCTFDNGLDNNAIHMNRLVAGFIKNITIKNSYMRNSESGMDIDGCDGCTIENNIITNNTIRGIAVGYTDNGTSYYAKNSIIKNNTLHDNGVSDIITYTINNISLIDNIYSDVIPQNGNIQVQDGTYSFNFSGSIVDNFKVWFSTTNSHASSAYVFWNYSGNAVFNISDNLVTLINQQQQFPYDDIKNVTSDTILYYSVDNQSITMHDAQIISIDNYPNCTIISNNSIWTTVAGYNELCYNNYNITVLLGASNAIINGGNAVLKSTVSDSKIAIDTNFRSNVTVYNFILINYSRGIYSRQCANCIFRNNIIYTNVSTDIFIDRTTNTLIYNNSLFGTFSGYQVGIYATVLNFTGTGFSLVTASSNTRTSNVSIFNNIISMLDNGLHISSNTTNIYFYNNNMSNFSSSGYPILTESNADNIGLDVFNNYIYFGGWDGITIRSSNVRVFDNIINETYHHGIDTLINGVDDSAVTTTQGNNSFYNNFIINTISDDPSYNSASVCAFLIQSENGSFYNNTCIGGMINMYGNIKHTKNWWVYNNNIINAESSGMQILVNNTYIENNTINNTISIDSNNNVTFITGADYLNRTMRLFIYFKNNTDLSGYNKYTFVNNGSQDVYIYETSTIGHRFSLPSTNTWLYMNYSGLKNILVESTRPSALTNTTIYFYNQQLQSPYNDVKNITTDTLLYTDIDNQVITLNNGQIISVGNYYITYCSIQSKMLCLNTCIDISSSCIYNPLYNRIGIRCVIGGCA